MKKRDIWQLLRCVTGTLVLSSVIWSSGSASAATNAAVTVSSPTGVINPGDKFTISINVQPNNAIAGMQFNLSYNPSVVTVDNVSEGNLLRQSGATTFFSKGTTNNSAGTITGVFGVIISPGQTTSAPGVLAVVAMTATGFGASPLALSNVVIGDVTSKSIPASITGNSVAVGHSSVTTPPPPSGGGGGIGNGGGGGGGVQVTLAGLTGTLFVDTLGNTRNATTLDSLDSNMKIDVPFGGKMLESNNLPITSLAAKLTSPSPKPPPQNAIVLAYDLSPDGITFSLPLTLTLRYNPANLPPEADENSLVIGYWNGSQWEIMETTVNGEADTASTQISHCSTYALLVHVNTPVAQPQTIPVPKEDGSASPTLSMVGHVPLQANQSDVPSVTNDQTVISIEEISPDAITRVPDQNSDDSIAESPKKDPANRLLADVGQITDRIPSSIMFVMSGLSIVVISAGLVLHRRRRT